MSEAVQKISIKRKEKNKLTPEMIQYIHNCANKLGYGKIIIDLNDHLHTLDITVEEKQRFQKN